MKKRGICLFVLILFTLIPISLAQDCNTLCLDSGYTSGICSEQCTEVKIIGGEDCKLSGNAVLSVGSEATHVYSDLDAFIDENSSDPDWVWIIKNAKTKGSTDIASTTNENTHAGPIIGVKNSFIANNIDTIDEPAKGIGGTFCFPGNIICVKFKGLTVSNYGTYSVQKTTVDLSSYNSSWTNKDAVMLFSEDTTDGLKIDTSSFDIATSGASGTKTQNIWIVFNNTGTYAGIFYKGSDNSKKVAGYVDMSSSGTDKNIADVDYKNTQDTEVQIDLRGDFATANNLDVVLDILGKDGLASEDRSDDITVNLKHSANDDFEGFGSTAGVAEDSDLVWVSTNIGTKDEDHRSLFGIIIKDPKQNNAGDKLLLEIPDDQVKAKIEISRKGNTATRVSSTGALKQGQEIPQPVFGKDLKFKEDFNLILIGGPCANPLVEKFIEFPKCSSWPLKEGESMIKYAMNGKNSALLIAGTTEEDTKEAVKFMNTFDKNIYRGTFIKIFRGRSEIINDLASGIDLSDFPFPFLKDGKVQNMNIIVGEKASQADILSAQEFATDLYWLTTASSVSQEVPETKNETIITADVPLGNNIADSTFFSPSIGVTELGSLIKSETIFQGKKTIFHEEIMLYGGGPTVATSLSSSDDTYTSNVYLEAVSGSLRYYLVLDNVVDLTKAAVDSPLSIDVLENPISITSAETATQIKSESGKKYFLDIGQKIRVENTDIKLLATNSDESIILEVNSSKAIFSPSETKFVSNLEIKNIRAFKQKGTECCCSDLSKYL